MKFLLAAHTNKNWFTLRKILMQLQNLQTYQNMKIDEDTESETDKEKGDLINGF